MELKNNKGLILIYPGYQNDAKKYQYNRIIEEFNKLGITIDKLKVDEVIIDIENGKTNLKLNEYDFCIQLVKDKYISKILNKNNIRCFNSYESIENCDDKMSTYILFSNNDIKMPNTNNMSTCSVIIYFSASMVLTYFCAVELQLDAVPS
jgi:hypothetical protein